MRSAASGDRHALPAGDGFKYPTEFRIHCVKSGHRFRLDRQYRDLDLPFQAVTVKPERFAKETFEAVATHSRAVSPPNYDNIAKVLGRKPLKQKPLAPDRLTVAEQLSDLTAPLQTQAARKLTSCGQP